MDLSPVQSFVLQLCTLLRPDGPGVYLEVGANDGLIQSNTLALERDLGWRGILVEASPKAFDALRVNRPNNHLAHAALVGRDFAGATVVGDFARGTPVGKLALASDLTSVPPARMAQALVSRVVKRFRGELVEVPARTLESVLHDSPFDKLDFMSLDVEGHEVGILRGCDLSTNPPQALLIEMSPPMVWPMIELLLRHRYAMVRNVSRFSRAQNPGWSQDHQDYLFLRSELLDRPDIRQLVFA